MPLFKARILSLFLFLFTLTAFAQPPKWYHNLSSKIPNTYIGYGQAKSEAQARNKALSDIVSQISVKVKSEFSSATVVSGDDVKKQARNTSSQKSHGDISDYKVEKFLSDNGLYYIALSYENISSFDKFVNSVKKKLPKKSEKQNRYLSKTLLASKLEKALGVDIDFKLQRKDELWYLSYKGTLVVLDKRGFESLFKSTLSDSMRFMTSKKNKPITEGQSFYFKFKADTKGYLSLLTVYEDGTVATLVNNIPVKANKVQNVPDKDFESELEAGLINPGEETFDLYVAIYTSAPIVMDSFTAADASLITLERYKNFDTLIEFLEDKKYATLKVVTKPR